MRFCQFFTSGRREVVPKITMGSPFSSAFFIASVKSSAHSVAIPSSAILSHCFSEK